jgi:hypothetical protein
MRSGAAILIGCTLVLGVAPAVQAQYDVTRRNYTFLQRNLAIEVEADAPGILHVVRGTSGQLQVAARSDGGFADFGLAGRPRTHLRLSSVGSNATQYVVVVPEHVRVQVRVPGQPPEAVAGNRTARFEWHSPAALEMPPPLAATPPRTTRERGLVEYNARTAPDVLDIADVRGIRTLEVRTGEDAFGISSTSAAEVLDLGNGRIGLRVTAATPADVVIRVPRGATDFIMTVAGEDAVVPVGGGRFEAVCVPVTTQQLAGGQRFTFSPEGRPLACRWT